RVSMPESQAECDLDIRDSELGHVDMEDFWARTQRVTRSPWMDKLKYKYQRVSMPESQAECDLDIRDSELGH
ncbi:hypothetical protein KI387_013740, partial [Taxus chinensis]